MRFLLPYSWKVSTIVAAFLFFFAVPIVHAADGSGTALITPTSTIVASSGNTLSVTYTTAETMLDGAFRLTIPDGWTSPTTTAASSGLLSAAVSTGTVATTLDTLDSVTGWTDTSGLVSESADTSIKKEGSASLSVNVTLGLGSAKAYLPLGAALDWSAWTKGGFWVRPSSNVSLGAMSFVVSETADMSVVSEQYNLPALTANVWTYVSFGFSSNSSTRDAVLSYGFQFPVTLANTYRFDNISVGPAMPAVVGQVVTVPFIDVPTSTVLTLTYGSGGGNTGVDAPLGAGTSTFASQSRVDSGGTFTNLSSSPSVETFLVPQTPVFIDSATQGQQADRVLTISKEFTTSSTNLYLLYTFSVSSDSAVDSVMWHDQPMTPLQIPTGFGDGQGIYVYGLADPDVGESYDAVVTMGEEEVVYDGAILLYGGASSTQPDTQGDFVIGQGWGTNGSVMIHTPGSIVLSVAKNGADADIEPKGDAVRRSSEHGGTTGSFGVFERGPFIHTVNYSVSTTFSEPADYSFITFALAPAIAPPPADPLQLLEIASGMGSGSTLTVSKNFLDVGTNRVLYMVVQTDADHAPEEVTWHGTPMSLIYEGAFVGVRSYMYTLQNPDVSGTFDAVVTMPEGGAVFMGALQLYANTISG